MRIECLMFESCRSVSRCRAFSEKSGYIMGEIDGNSSHFAYISHMLHSALTSEKTMKVVKILKMKNFVHSKTS